MDNPDLYVVCGNNGALSSRRGNVDGGNQDSKARRIQGLIGTIGCKWLAIAATAAIAATVGAGAGLLSPSADYSLPSPVCCFAADFYP